MYKKVQYLRRFEEKIMGILKKSGKLGSLHQVGFSRINKEKFRFPIYGLAIGKPSALKNRSVFFVAGVHGLETIAIRILLDFLERVAAGKELQNEIQSGRIGIYAIPVLNPGGVAARTRSNPAGVDLMRNSGVIAEKPLPFFGGQKISNILPYFRGAKLEPESIALFRFLRTIYNPSRKTPLPVLDVHSGYGNKNYVWWPYAYTQRPVPDDIAYRRITNFLKETCHNDQYHYGPQSEMYTSHGDLWDLYYLHFLKYREMKKMACPFLPLTLEIGTWNQLKESPKRMLNKHNLFNPPKETRKTFVRGHRNFLTDFSRLATLPRREFV